MALLSFAIAGALAIRRHRLHVPPTILGMPLPALVSFDSLSRPTFFDTDEGANCSSTLALDGDGRFWTEHGCEAHSSGVHSPGTVRPETRLRLQAALDKLRQLPDRQSVGCSGAFTRRFMLMERDGTRRVWDVCPPEKPEGWEPAFHELLEAISAAERR